MACGFPDNLIVVDPNTLISLKMLDIWLWKFHQIPRSINHKTNDFYITRLVGKSQAKKVKKPQKIPVL